jgi:hypothetical protein
MKQMSILLEIKASLDTGFDSCYLYLEKRKLAQSHTDGNQIPQEETAIHLSIYLDRRMTWRAHIHYLLKETSWG